MTSAAEAVCVHTTDCAHPAAAAAAAAAADDDEMMR